MRSILGILASGVFLIRLLPQPLRLARTGVSAGVSPLAAINATAVTLAWLVYGVEARLPIVWVVSILALIPSVWNLALLIPATSRSDLTFGATWIAALVIAWFGGWLAGSLAVGVVVTQGPQVRRAVRDSDLSGLAPATWWVSLLDAATWGAYGAALGDRALLGYAVVLSSCAVVVLVRLRMTSRTSTQSRHVTSRPVRSTNDDPGPPLGMTTSPVLHPDQPLEMP